MNEIDEHLFNNEPKLWGLKKKIESWIQANEDLAFPGFAGITNAWQQVLNEIEWMVKGEIANKAIESDLK